jgi:segregation and condensation protein A
MFEIETEGFSGPLDLLCELIESGSLDFAQIRLSEIVFLYTTYLRKKEELPLNEILHFLSLTSQLLHGKAFSLFPSPKSEDLWGEDEEEFPVERVVGLYKPYRQAVACLQELLAERQRCFPRISHDGALFFDAGDLYMLGMIWWDLLEECRKRKKDFSEEFPGDESEDFWEGVPAAIPEEGQVESRMEELRRLLEQERSLSFQDLLGDRKSKAFVVLTLLALLEMCRKEEVSIIQKEVFGNIHVWSA